MAKKKVKLAKIIGKRSYLFLHLSVIDVKVN